MSIGSDKSSRRGGRQSIGSKSSLGAEEIRLECSYGIAARLFFLFIFKLNTEEGLIALEFVAATITLTVTTYQCGFETETVMGAGYAIGYASDLLATLATVGRLRINIQQVRHAKEDASTFVMPRLREMRAKRVGMAVQLLLTIPFDAVLWATDAREAIRWVRLIHLAPGFFRIPRFFAKLERSPAMPFFTSRFLRTVVYFFLSTHLLACLFAYLAEEPLANWYYNSANWRSRINPNNTAYPRTIYFSFLSFSAALTDNRSVDRSPGNGPDWEYMVGIFIIMLTNIVFFYIDANLTAIMLSTFRRIEGYRNKLTAILMYLKRNHLSSKLSTLVFEHCQRTYEEGDVSNKEELLLEQLPLTLSREVRHEKNIRTLRRAPLFFGCDRAVLRMLAGRMRQVNFIPGEKVCSKGEVILEALLLQSGALEAVQEDSLSDESDESDESADERMDVNVGVDVGSRRPIVGRLSHLGRGRAQPRREPLQDEQTNRMAAAPSINAPSHDLVMNFDDSGIQGLECRCTSARPSEEVKDGCRVSSRIHTPPRLRSSAEEADRRARSSSSMKGVSKRRSSLINLGEQISALGKHTLENLGVALPGADVAPYEQATIVTPGSAVCELAFLFRLRQPETLVAVKRTTCLLLDVESWFLLSKDFPHDAHRIRNTVLSEALEADYSHEIKQQLTAIKEEQARSVARLFTAVGNGDEPAVYALVDPYQGFVDPSEVDYAGNTPLHVAAMGGYLGVVDTLILFKAPLSAKDACGCTPLAVALDSGHHEIAETIQEAGGKLEWDEATTAYELLAAVKAGNLDRLMVLIRCGANLNAANYDRRTALHLAASTGKRRYVEMLLRNKADVNPIDMLGATPLRNAVFANQRKVAKILFRLNGHLNYDESTASGELCELAREGDAERLQLLISCGCKVNAEDYDRRRCTHLTSAGGNKVIMTLLIRGGASINCVDRWGGTPLHDAIVFGHLNLAKSIIRHGGRLKMDDKKASSELCDHAREGRLERVRLMLDGRVNVNAADYDLRTCLHLAASTGNFLLIQTLIDFRCNISAKDRWGHTPLADAINAGFNEVAKLLIRQGADLGFDEETSAEGVFLMIEELIRFGANLNRKDRWGGTPLADAVREGHGKVAKLLFQRGATLGFDEAKTSLALGGYARVGDLEKLKLMLACGASVNAADNERRTCMHFAASVGNLKVVQALIEAGANLNLVDRLGRTPLGNAVREGHRHVAHAIREAGGEVLYDEATTSGELCEMARCGNIEGIKLLLSGGCSVNAADYDQRTCMHLAASSGNLLVVEALIEHKCDLNAKDRWGGTPLADAVREGHQHVASVLRSLDASLGMSDVCASQTLVQKVIIGDSKGVAMLLENGIQINVLNYDLQTGLHVAAAAGYLGITRQLIEFKADLSLVNRRGATVLGEAVSKRHGQVARAIREAGGEVLYDEATTSGELCEMARCGNIDGIKLLLSGGCSVNAADYDQRTCMHLAASSGNLLVVEALIEHKCDLNAKDRWGGTPLADAVREGHGQIARVLRAAGASLGFQTEDHGVHELCERARIGDSKGVAMLLEAGVSANARDYQQRTCLHITSRGGNISTIATLIDGMADLTAEDVDRRTCLHVAASTGRLAVVEKLLAFKDRLNINGLDRWGFTPVGDAVLQGFHEVAQTIVQKGGELRFSRDRAVLELFTAARQGDMSLIRLLIDAGVDPNATDYDRRSCLMVAASAANTAAVQLLLDKGADINAKDRWEGTALADAIRQGHRRVVHMLTSRGGQLFWDQLTIASHLCDLAANGSIEKLEYLLDCGIDPMTCDYDGRTALHLAASAGHAHIVHLLLSHGADIAFKDRWGGTALDDAEREGRSIVVEMLRSLEKLPDATKQASPRVATPTRLLMIKLMETRCNSPQPMRQMGVALMMLMGLWRSSLQLMEMRCPSLLLMMLMRVPLMKLMETFSSLQATRQLGMTLMLLMEPSCYSQQPISPMGVLLVKRMEKRCNSLQPMRPMGVPLKTLMQTRSCSL
ncbi:hypothetical protein AB1Y20_015779 [Prymnesium parvum]|uniref:Cyclic nucleotide-binding domain-containing protein n=1 Tax=Prymnesium parvum TaxID=97485 RepID=A0AB34K1Z5_PRYPA